MINMISIEFFMIISIIYIPLIPFILILGYYFNIYEKKKGLIITLILTLSIGYSLLSIPIILLL